MTVLPKNMQELVCRRETGILSGRGSGSVNLQDGVYRAKNSCVTLPVTVQTEVTRLLLSAIKMLEVRLVGGNKLFPPVG